MRQEIISAASKAAPPVGVTVWQYLLGLPVEKWVAVATLIYILLQAAVLVRKEFFKRRRTSRKLAASK